MSDVADVSTANLPVQSPTEVGVDRQWPYRADARRRSDRMIDHVCFWHLVDIRAVAALVRYWTQASEGDETAYEKARAIIRASKNVEVWSGSAQVGGHPAARERISCYGRCCIFSQCNDDSGVLRPHLKFIVQRADRDLRHHHRQHEAAHHVVRKRNWR